MHILLDETDTQVLVVFKLLGRVINYAIISIILFKKELKMRISAILSTLFGSICLMMYILSDETDT